MSRKMISLTMLTHLYAQDPAKLTRWAALILLLWTALIFLTGRQRWSKKAFAYFCIPLSIAALYGILRYTVLGRSPSSEHSFVFFAAHTNEFYREMFMNALLYFPLGLSLTVLLGPWSILAAFALSLGIESWQYFAGTGLAQGTDVIMNTFGAAIGALPWIIVRCITALQSRRFGPCK